MSNYAIIRFAKLSNLEEVRASLSHCFREQPTRNADPARRDGNSHFRADTVETAMEALNSRLPKRPRKNGVLVMEYLITASPEAMEGMTREEQDAYLADALAWLQKRHGLANIIVASIHRDETTPHLSVFVVPLDKRGRMNARGFSDGRAELVRFQTDFADQVGTRHKLIRGLSGSAATHISIKAYYQSLRDAEQLIGKAEAIIASQESLDTNARFDGKVSPEIAAAVTKSGALAAEISRLKNENQRLERANATALSKIERLTESLPPELPFRFVICQLGGSPVKDTKERQWQTPRGTIEIDPARPRWFRLVEDDAESHCGVIDLIRAIDGASFDHAVDILGRLEHPAISVPSILAEVSWASVEKVKHRVGQVFEKASSFRSISAPLNLEHSGAAVDEIRHHLVQDRKISAQLVDFLIAAKRLAAAKFGSRAHAAYLLGKFSDDDVPSWAIASTKTDYRGIRGSVRPFRIIFARIEKPSRLETITIFVEAPIDALAVVTAVRAADKYPNFNGFRVVATNECPFELLRQVVRREASFSRALVSGFSRDNHGRTLAGHLTRAIREEKIEIDNTGVQPIDWPEGCTRWADAWVRMHSSREDGIPMTAAPNTSPPY